MRHPPLFPLLRAGAITAFLAALLLYRPKRAPEVQPEGSPPGVWATDVDGASAGPLRVGEKATGPLEGQKRPPCNRDVEVEVAGACWIPHQRRPPCPPGLYEGSNLCLVPVKAAQRPPTTFGR